MTPTASRRSLLAGITVGAVVGAAGCLADDRDVEEPVTETHPATDFSAVAVSTAIGDVGIRPISGDELTVDGRKAAVTGDDLQTIGLETTVEEGVLEVAVARDDSRTLFGLRPEPVLDLSVGVPERLAVQTVETETGAIDLRGVRGVREGLAATTETGSVHIGDVDGSVSVTTETGGVEVVDPESIDRLETDTGDITASLPGLEGDATVATTTGDVELRLPDRLDLTLDVATETGEISVTDIEDLPEMAGDSLIEAVVGNGTHRLEVRTETGNVTVTGRERSDE